MIKYLKHLWYKRQHQYGTYVSANLSVHSKHEFTDWMQGLQLDSELVSIAPDDYHATISYSLTPMPAVLAHRFDLPITARVSGWRIFDNTEADGLRCLVAVLDSTDLHKVNAQMALQYRATSTFAEYIPHVTISYTYSLDQVPASIPPFELVFDSITVEPLDESKYKA